MVVVILTSATQDIASRVIPELVRCNGVILDRVILSRGSSLTRKKRFDRIIKKIKKIGVLGAFIGVRLRSWYIDKNTIDLREICQTFNITLEETPAVNSDKTRDLFRQSKADIGLSLGNGYIPKSVFSIPRFGMINIHMELLPEFRGAQSIIWPIYKSKKETGFTIHQIDSKIDNGEILFKESHPILFSRDLRETVERNLQVTRERIPGAFNFVLENYASLRAKAEPQAAGQSYTTPSALQFLKMVRNNRKFYKENRQK